MKARVIKCLCKRERILNPGWTKDKVNYCPCGLACYWEDKEPMGRSTEGRDKPEIVRLKFLGYTEV